MAQKILLRRGGLANVNSGATIAVSQGEQLFGSGSLSNTNIGDIVFVANADGNGAFVPVGRLFTGTAAADGFDSKLNGLPYYRTDENALYRLGESSALDLSGNLEGTVISSIEASGSFSGSFVGDGSNLTGLAVGSIAAPGSDTQILFNNGGTIAASSNLTINGNILDVNGTISGSELYLSGNASIDGNVVIGGNITIGDQTTDFVNFGAEVTSNFVPDADSTYDLGTSDKRWRNIYVDHLSGSTITVDGNIVTEGTVEASGNVVGANFETAGDLTALDVNIGEWGSVSASLASLETNAGAAGLQQVTDINSVTTNTINAGGLVVSGSSVIGNAIANTVTINAGTIALTNLSAGTDNTVLVLNSSDEIVTDEIDSRVWGSGLVGNTGTPVDNQLAIFTNANTVEGSSDVTYDGSTFTVAADVDADDVTIDGWGSVSASLAAIESGANALSLDDVTSVGATTANSIQVGGLTVTGDLTVQGTTTTVDSTEVNIGDNILTLNAAGGAADGGIQVIDAVTTQHTGSLLWNATNDYWYAGVSGSTHYRLATFTNATPTSNAIPKIDANKRLVASSLTDDGSTIAISGLSNNSFLHSNGSKKLTSVTPTTAGDVMQWNGSAFVASNVIDGGTF